MKKEIRYRIKDLPYSKKMGRDTFVSNASNSTIYRGRKHVANKIEDLVKYNSRFYDEFEVCVYEMVVTDTISSQMFVDELLGNEKRKKKAQQRKNTKINEIKMKAKRITGLSFHESHDLWYKNSGILNDKTKFELTQVFNEYDEVKKKPLEDFFE